MAHPGLPTRQPWDSWRAGSHCWRVMVDIGPPTIIGSILGPLLFIIYLNDFTNASDIFKIILYADDSTLLARLSDFNNRDNKENNNVLLNTGLEKNCVWLKINRLSLNISKSKFMFFISVKKRVAIPNIKINKTDLQCIDNFNFLGLTFHKHLGWADHVNKLSNKNM